MDGAKLISTEIAPIKANTSVKTGALSRAIADGNLANPNRPYAHLPGIVVLAGGVPT